MELQDYLKIMVKYEASDLYLTTAAPPTVKVHGKLKAIEDAVLPPNRVKVIAYQLMDDEAREAFDDTPEMNLALSERGIGRFRVNIFKQRNQVGMVVRHIKTDIPSPENLQLPDILKKIVMQPRGLVLFVGGTGTGKSTTMASLVDYRNAKSGGHIITIEDPIEFIHQHKKSIVNQREVGIDTHSYADALKNTLRQAPDVILIGEVRDRETMEHAIAFAETGHLVLSTLHANNANQAFDRIVNFFSDDRRKQVLMDLALNTRAIISQRLIQTPEQKRIVAIEVLISSPLIADLILKGDFHEMKAVMEKSENLGMQTFDFALYQLYKAGRISMEEALRNADSANNLRIRISLEEANKPNEIIDLSLKDDKDNLTGGSLNLL